MELPRQTVIELPTLWGIDFSITNEVILLWIAAIITFVLVTLACRRKNMVAKGTFQNFFEATIEYIDQTVGEEVLGEQAKKWSPFLLSLFFFILFNNLLGLAPLPHHVKSMTSSINVTAAFASMVFLITVAVNIKTHGVLGFMKKFVPPGLPFAVKLFAVPIEFMSWLARPFSLAVRLFANMLAGHTLITVFITMACALSAFIKPLPYLGAVLMSLFELFVCFVQSFIFTLLAGIYIKDAIETH